MRDLAFAAIRLMELLGAGALVGCGTYRISTFLTGTKTGHRS